MKWARSTGTGEAEPQPAASAAIGATSRRSSGRAIRDKFLPARRRDGGERGERYFAERACGAEPVDLDARRIVSAQAARALAYGLGSVLIGVTLARRGLSGSQVGFVLAGLLAGIVFVSVLIARYGDRVGRRRCYRLLFVGMAGAGTVFALTGSLPALVLAGADGDGLDYVVESGPFTSSSRCSRMSPAATIRRGSSGSDNAIATLAGSAGALIALLGASPHWLLAYPLAAAAGIAATVGISDAVEVGPAKGEVARRPLDRSRPIVLRLSGLFALDSLGGGFVPQTFIAYLFVRKFGASPHALALVFCGIGVLQALSFRAAVWLAARFGLLRTMVFSHLPSNVLLAGIAFSRPVSPGGSCFCWPVRSCRRWTCSHARPTSSPSSIRASGRPPPGTRTQPAT